MSGAFNLAQAQRLGRSQSVSVRAVIAQAHRRVERVKRSETRPSTDRQDKAH